MSEPAPPVANLALEASVIGPPLSWAALDPLVCQAQDKPITASPGANARGQSFPGASANFVQGSTDLRGLVNGGVTDTPNWPLFLSDCVQDYL